MNWARDVFVAIAWEKEQDHDKVLLQECCREHVDLRNWEQPTIIHAYFFTDAHWNLLHRKASDIKYLTIIFTRQ